MNNHHDCPGLAQCIDHPKWSVLFGQPGRWEAIAPGPEYDDRSRFFLTSHAVAINHAQKEATLEAYRQRAENWTQEDEAFSQAAHKRSVEVVRRSILKEESNE